MKIAFVAMLGAALCLTGCAFTAPMATQTTPGSRARILPNTAVKLCRSNGAICEPPSTTYQGHFSGHVDAFGDVSIDPPDGLPMQ